MNVNFVAGVAATVALLVPVGLIVVSKLFSNTSLLALLANYVLTALYNLMSLQIIHLSAAALHQCAALFNYLDAPLTLVGFFFFCHEKDKRQVVFAALGVTLFFEILMLLQYGLDVKSNMYALGLGTPVVLALSIYFFASFGKMTIVQGKSLGKTLMLVSLIFSYGCFLVLYALYYLINTSYIADVTFMYHIITFISATIMAVGLVWVWKRSREIKELQQTRKELAQFFEM